MYLQNSSALFSDKAKKVKPHEQKILSSTEVHQRNQPEFDACLCDLLSEIFIIIIIRSIGQREENNSCRHNSVEKVIAKHAKGQSPGLLMFSQTLVETLITLDMKPEQDYLRLRVTY